MSNKESNYERYTKTGCYAALLKTYDLEEPGLWQIFGEDPNNDLDGSHIKPSLGFVEGTLDDVIEYAVELPGFWQWGVGGDIEKVEGIKKVDSKTSARRKYLREHRVYLEDQIKLVDAELEKL